ncbi:MAG: hypothetical protein AB2411_03460 [Mesobacillus sp.]|jgi:hypothetical protein
MYSRLSRNAETGDSDKEALFASAGGVEVSEFLGGELDKRLEELGAAARQAIRAAKKLTLPAGYSKMHCRGNTGKAPELDIT